MKSPPPKFQFGKQLRELRRRQGLTQKELGDLVGVSLRVIFYYENETEYPPSHILEGLSKTLKVSTDGLLGIKKLPELPKNGRVWRKFKMVETMLPRKQRQVFDFIRLVKNQK